MRLYTSKNKIEKTMQKIKYQQLKYNEALADEFSLHQNMSTNYLEECKRHWLLKVLFLCFVIIKAFYLINNFEMSNESVNQTDIIFANKTRLYAGAVEKIFDFPNKTLKQKNNSLATSLSYYHSHSVNISNTSAIEYANNVTTFDNKYFKNMTKKSNDNNIEDNHYDNVDLTTSKIINSKNDSKVKIINLNANNINKTSIRKTVNIVYTNETLSHTTEKVISDLQTVSNIKTTTILPMTPSASPTSAVKSSFPANDKRYFINTSHCHVPFVEPFTPEIRKIFKPQHSTGCTKDQPIITSSFDEIEAHYILHINYTVAEDLRKKTKKNIPIEDDLLCCYQQIVRSGSGAHVDTSFKLLPCSNFHQGFVLPLHIEGIIVNCKSKSMKSTLQEDAFSFVQINKTLIQQELQNTTIKSRKPSILMIGIDTLSRINFRRNMPETFKYLVDNSWYELMGYNKVGDNTLPNLMPLLAGYTKETVNEKCHPKNVGGFDNCNFIWTKFKSNGYHTAYAEDSTFLSTFNYNLKGFKNPPTDHYFRPMALAIEKSLKTKKKAGLNYCLGRRQFGEYIYDYGTEFASRFKNLSSFGFFWTNSFSHNSYDVSATMDKQMVKYFKEWKSRGILKDSVVMFFSDHGTRWGPLLKLSEGFLEERLPMFFIYLPEWFRQKYPQLQKNLEINQKRLSNPFDVHMTLQHLLKLAEPNYKIQQAFDCPKCQSIFEELPENRTCDDASIPEAWCTCLPFRTESTKNKIVQTVAELIIKEMNNYYELKNLTSLCSRLQLKEIINAKLRYINENMSLSNITTYAIEFTTEPITKPMTLFGAVVDYDVQNNSIHLNVEDISRQTSYEKTSNCTDDKQAKKYCICKNSLKL